MQHAMAQDEDDTVPVPIVVGDCGMALPVRGASDEDTTARVRAVAAAIEQAAIAGVTDVVPSLERVTVVYDPCVVDDLDALHDRLGLVAGNAVGPGSRRDATTSRATTHHLPVAYDGPDLDEVCRFHGIHRDRLVTLHTGPDYLVQAIGFLPGFGYLSGLPAALATPRRATPRPRIAAGSVGIGGSHTGVYPCASPGGWNLIGRSSAVLFDPSRARPSLVAVGDRVRFLAVDHVEPPPPPLVSPRGGIEGITVVSPGLFTTVQDLGRPGHRSAGVPLSGAVDPLSLQRANRLVGNPADAACLEITLLAPELRCERSVTVALAGAAFPGLPGDCAIDVPPGGTLAPGHAVAGCRGYLAVAGGIDVARVLGSRSTFVPARLGGLTGLSLAAGDRLPIGSATGLAPRVMPDGPAVAAPPEGRALRIVRGAEFDRVGDRLLAAAHRVTSRSDRMGVRLDGEPLGRPDAAAGSQVSVGVLPGTVQLPPDGRPIILLADAQTIGGYPVIAHVITADLPLVAQLRPGDRVRWREVSLAEAHAALRGQAAAVGRSVGADA